VVIDLLLVVYVGLLIRMRNLAAEREMKLTFLPHLAELHQGSRAARSSRAAEGHGAAGYAAGGYGDILATRTAN
jgi:hypothetical protein